MVRFTSLLNGSAARPESHRWLRFLSINVRVLVEFEMMPHMRDDFLVLSFKPPQTAPRCSRKPAL